MKHRATKVISLTLVSILLSVLVTPSANSVPEGVTYTGDTRTVPIFAIWQEGNEQPTQVVSTGFLYSSRIVFTAGVQEKFFDQAKGGIYVGKPGSRTTDNSGRVKVLKAFYPNSGNAELDDFVVFVLEEDLASVQPFPLLQMGQESSAREASVRGYGEYLNRCGPGVQGPCPEKPTSEVPRQINVKVIPLSQAENLVGYERSQLSGQIILQNARNAQDGVVCRGDTGSPVIGNFGGTSIYLGAASKAMNAKICGAVGVEKVERDKPKVNSSFDGIAGITHIAPVYRFSNVIDEARNYVAEMAKPTPTPTPVPVPDLSEKQKQLRAEIKVCPFKYEREIGFRTDRIGKKVYLEWVGYPKEIYKILAGTIIQSNSLTKEWFEEQKKQKYAVCRFVGQDGYGENIIAFKFQKDVSQSKKVHITDEFTWKKGQDLVLLQTISGDRSTMDFDIIVQSGQASFRSSAVCISNRYIPIEGLFSTVGASSKLALTYLSYLPGGAILSTVGSTAISTFGGITSAKLNNKWENTSSGVNVVYGTVGIVAAAGEDITKMSKMTFKTAGGTNVKLVLKDVVKNASKSGAGKIYLVAGVTLALEDVKNLGEALQEMKNGKQQNELKLACNAAYAG